jgi:hypothetical protein
MTARNWIASSLACAMLFATALLAQDNPPSAPGENPDLAGIPAPRGVYYHAAGGWVALSPTVLLPLSDGRPAALEVLNVGSDHTITQLPGRHAGIQILSDARPTFYLHGISPADLYLVRAVSKADYRELRMQNSRHFWEWAHFLDKDVTDFGIEAVNGDIVAIKPVSALKPGEYTLASVMGRDYQWLRLGFDFGILGGATGQ